VVRYNHDEDVGLYLRMRCTQELLEQVVPLLKELGARGLGGDRSIGNGAFLVDEEPIKNDLSITPNTTRKWICLSPYYPTKDEVLAGVLKNSSYQLLDRSGWIDQSPFQRQRVRMLAEGTILQGIEAKPGGYGDVVDVTPEIASHPVKRYGRAYLWPVE
jgi:CRISPR-associated protein Csm4